MQTYRNTALVATAVLVNAEPCVVRDVDLANINTSDCWVHIYNAAAAADVTVGTTTPIHSFHVPLGDGVDYGRFATSFASPKKMSTGLVVAATTTVGGNTAPGTGIVTHIGYD